MNFANKLNQIWLQVIFLLYYLHAYPIRRKSLKDFPAAQTVLLPNRSMTNIFFPISKKLLSEENQEDIIKVPFGVEIFFNGEKRIIQAEQQNVIKLMLDIYEGAIHQNEKLIQTQEELRLLNERLESLVEDRTADLTEEIKLSNQIAAKLKESEEKYRRIFENVQDLYYETSIEGTIIEISPSIEILSKGQYHRDDLIGKSMNNFYSDIDERATLISQIKEKGTVSDYEIILKNKDGSWIPCSVSSKIFFDAHGRPEKIIGSVRDISGRKKAEETIRVLARFPSENPDPVLRVDLNGRLLYANEVSFNLLTWKLEIGKEIPSFLQKIISEALKEGIVKNIETEHYNNNFSLSIVPILEEGYINLYCRNITDQKKVEEVLRESESSLRESEEKFRSIMENSADAIFLADQQGKYLYANKAVTEMLGFTQEEMQSKTIIDLAPPDKTDEYFEVFKKILSKGKGFTEIELLKKDGTFISTDLNAVLLPGGLMYGSCRDITERKNAEEVLQQSFAFSESLLKTIPFGMDIVSETGTILFQSENFRRMFGEEAIGKKCWEMYRDDKKQCGDCPLIHGITVGETELYESHDVLGNRIFEINHTGMIYQGKKAMLEIFQDITDRKENEEELIRAKEKAEESDRLKSAFLTNMSHEIRTPMNGILGFAELLIEPNLSSDDLQDYIQTIQISGTRMLNTINSIVDMSKIESGLIQNDIKETDINEKLEFTYKFFKPEADIKGLQLILKTGLPDKEAIVKTDNEKVYGILTNLVRNAIKFTFEGSIELGYVLKSGSEPGSTEPGRSDKLEFYVKDTGVGIPDNQKELIFERFRQGSESHNRGYEGSGLGLSIAKSFVEMLGGEIWVESKEGLGSTFYFTIPYNTVSEENVEIKNAGSEEQKEVQLENMKILIVEDDEISYSLLTRMLKNISKTVLHAITGVEAVEVCRNNPDIDLVLMDIRMPRMDGNEATRQIRQFNKDVIIIAQTAYVFAGDSEKAIEAGCNDYISKPVNKTLLNELIKKYINK